MLVVPKWSTQLWWNTFQERLWLTLHIGPIRIQFLASTETRGIAPALVKTHSSNMEGTREVLLSHFQNPDFRYNDLRLDPRSSKKMFSVYKWVVYTFQGECFTSWITYSSCFSLPHFSNQKTEIIQSNMLYKKCFSFHNPA